MTRPHTVTRRALLSAGGACFAGSLLLDAWVFGSAASQDTGVVWRERWADATHREFTPVDPGPDSLSRTWSVDVGERTEPSVECVGTDCVYVRDYNRILAYDRTDGRQVWEYAAHEGSFSLPTLIGETVLVQENATVHAVDANDGTARWTGHFYPSHQPFSTLITLDGDAYLPSKYRYLEVHPQTGFERRSFDADLLGTLVAADDDLMLWWDGGTLSATDRDGAVQWDRPIGRAHPPSGRALAVTDSAVVLRHLSGDGSAVTALDRDRGSILWDVETDVHDGTAVTTGSKTVYLTNNHDVRALEASTGTVRWRQSTGQSTPQPVATPETVYLPTAEGIRPVDPETGDQHAPRLLTGNSVDSLALVGDALYVVDDTELVALEVTA